MYGAPSSVAVAMLVMCAGACGAPGNAPGVAIAIEQVLRDGTVPQADVAKDVAVTVVADADRVLPPATSAAAFLDVELADGDATHTSVIVDDTGARKPAAPLAGAALVLSFEAPCCGDAATAFVALTDDAGLVAAAFENAPAAQNVGGIAVSSDGLRTLPGVTACGAVDAIAVKFTADDTLSLASGESGTVRAHGNDVDIHDALSEHVDDLACTDSLQGDVATWTAARASPR